MKKKLINNFIKWKTGIQQQRNTTKNEKATMMEKTFVMDKSEKKYS